MIQHDTLFPPERAYATIPLTDNLAGTLQVDMVTVQCTYCGDTWLNIPDDDGQEPECDLCGVGHGQEIPL